MRSLLQVETSKKFDAYFSDSMFKDYEQWHADEMVFNMTYDTLDNFSNEMSDSNDLF